VAAESTEQTKASSRASVRAQWWIRTMVKQRKRYRALTPEKPPPECLMVVEKSDGPNGCDMFIVFNGQKIAKRGYPDTASWHLDFIGARLRGLR
jgi:hypothetical protein